ncbi:MAG: nicotinate phosphoribosyltransferase [Frankiales bacterium]|nr:nicotinate phosphoribosyltransferase [Frankiales bacterium]
MPEPVPLLTDRYELTMLAGAVADGLADRRAVFEVFCRRLPPGRRFAVAAGQGRLAGLLDALVWDDTAMAAAEPLLDPRTLAWLDGRKPTPEVWSYPEGEVFVPGSPVLTVDGTFGDGLLLETLSLSVLNHDSAIASAAARMVLAAGDRPLIDMGSRRTHERAAVAAARAAWIAGFAGTSNLAAGCLYGIPTFGTSAHAFVLAHESEREAFAAQVASQGTGTTLLVDTFSVLDGVRTAVEVAGPELRAVRIDSGELGPLAREVRALLDALGATGTRIVATSDLDEQQIAALADDPVDEYGVGTALVTGSGAPTAGLVYKLVAIEDDAGAMRPVAKRSPGKSTVSGRKWAYRDGTREVLRLAPGAGTPLQVPLVDDLAAARARCARALAALPPEARDLSPGEPAWTAVPV